MKSSIKPLRGLIPRLEPYLLPIGAAQVATDTVLLTGAAVPLKEPSQVATLAKAGEKQTIYRYGQNQPNTQHWFHWAGDVDVTRGPVLSDPNERVYYSGDGEPKYTDATIATATAQMPSAHRILGIPAPTACTISAGGSATPESSPVRILVSYSFVTANGEPGPPAPVSNYLDIYPGQTLEVSQLDGSPSGAYDITNKRIWVSQTDSDGDTRLRYWKDVPIASSSTGGAAVDFTLLGEAVDDPSLIAPPADLFGLGLHPNGFLFGFTTRRFCRSEVWRPYGWPSEYQDPIGDDIVGGAVIGQSVVICTKGLTYVATGSDPRNMSIVDLAGTQPCAAKRSIAKAPFGVLYVSADGLVLVSGTAPLVLVTNGHFTPSQWKAFAPESMHCKMQDNRLYCWFDNGVEQGALVFEFDGGGGIINLTRTDVYATASFLDRDGELYVALPSNDNAYQWDAGAAREQVWRSGDMELDRPRAKAAVRLRGDFPMTFRYFGDGTQVCNLTITDKSPFMAPVFNRHRIIAVEVRSTGKIEEIEIADSIGELRANDG